MTKNELNAAVESARAETKAALQTVYDSLNHGQQNKLIKDETVVNLIDEVGYEDNMRLSTSAGNTKGATGTVTSGFIEIGVQGDVYRTSGVNFTSTASGNNLIGFYDSDKNFTTHTLHFGTANSTASGQGFDWAIDANGNLTLTLNADARTGDFFRIVGYGSGANLIVTKNQEID